MQLGRKQDRILFLSRQSNNATIDVRMLLEYLQEHYPQIPCTCLAREIGPGAAGLLKYIPFMLRQMRHLAISRVVILDGYCIPVCILPHDPDRKVIQLWHAIAAVKQFGYQTVGRTSGRSPQMAQALRMHRNYDYVLCCSPEVGRQFCQGFQVEPSKLLYMGLPRIDVICAGAEDAADAKSAGREKLRDRYGIPEGKEIILYVPTFRRNRPTDWREVARALDPERFVLVLKLHELDVKSRELLDREMTEAAAGDLQIISGDGRSTYQWLRDCHRIITDYSSLGVEASLTGKPIYFYVSDIEAYCQEVGLNVDPRRELPASTACSPQELARILEGEWDPRPQQAFREKYISVPTEHCTEDLAAFAVRLLEEGRS